MRNALTQQKSRLHIVAGALFLASVLHLVWFWGGAVQIPGTGAHLLASAKRQAPIRLGYMVAGRWLTNAVGAREQAIAGAERTLTPAAIARIDEAPDVAMDVVSTGNYGGAHAFLKAVDWAAPILLLVWIVLFARRNRSVHFTRSRR